MRPPDVDFAVRRASAADLGNVIILWRAYQQELGIDLCFQGFEEELATLPGRYAPPAGCLLVATCRGQTAGCVGLRTLSPGRGEIKRMVVAPAWRRRGVAERLMQPLPGAIMHHLGTNHSQDTLSLARPFSPPTLF